MEEDFVTLVSCRTLAEADLIVSDLAGAGIAAFVPDQFLMQNFSLPNAFGYVRVQVARQDQAAAKELLSAVPTGDSTTSPPDNGDGGPAE